MAKNENGKVSKVLDKKSMKQTKGGIIAVLRAEATSSPDAPISDITVRKAGEKPLEY